MLNNTWGSIKKNPDLVIMLVAGSIVALLGLTQTLPQEVVAAAILGILVVLSFALWHNRTREEELQFAAGRILDTLQDYFPGRMFKEYVDYRNSLREDIAKADEVWVLSRTCQSIWADFNAELSELLTSPKNGRVRLMLVDPCNSLSALKMIVQSSQWDSTPTPDLLQARIMGFLTSLAEKLPDQFSTQSLQVRTIDYLPAWTLFLIDPESKDGRNRIYVELATFPNAPNARPTFRLIANRDEPWFSRMKTEFKSMWDAEKVTYKMEVQSNGKEKWKLTPIAPCPQRD
jgi:hypothetical protein